MRERPARAEGRQDLRHLIALELVGDERDVLKIREYLAADGDVRGDQRNQVSLVPAFQFGGTEPAQRPEK